MASKNNKIAAVKNASVKQYQGMEHIPFYVRQPITLGPFNMDSDINSAKIYRLRSNIYAMGVNHKFVNLIFGQAADIQIYKENGDVDDELSEHVQMVMEDPSVDIQTAMAQSWSDADYWYGMSIFNPIWEKGDGSNDVDKGEIIPSKLIRLPVHTFDTSPTNRPLAYSQILQGITINPLDGITKEYWQRQSMYNSIPIPLDPKYLFTVQNPAGVELAGEPLIKPLLPVYEMLAYAWNCELQRMTRVGSPTIFFEQTEQPLELANEANGQISDVQRYQTIAQNWGKDQVYMLPKSFTINQAALELNRYQSNVLPTIQELWKMVIDYMTPSQFLGKEGSLIGSDSREQGEFLRAYIHGVHRWIEAAWNPFVQKYLDLNGYKGYYAKVEFPALQADMGQINVARANLLLQKPGAGSVNEFREFLDLPEAAPNELTDWAAEWDSITPAPPMMLGPDGKPVQGPGDDKNPFQKGAQKPGEKSPPDEKAKDKENETALQWAAKYKGHSNERMRGPMPDPIRQPIARAHRELIANREAMSKRIEKLLGESITKMH